MNEVIHVPLFVSPEIVQERHSVDAVRLDGAHGLVDRVVNDVVRNGPRTRVHVHEAKQRVRVFEAKQGRRQSFGLLRKPRGLVNQARDIRCPQLLK